MHISNSQARRMAAKQSGHLDHATLRMLAGIPVLAALAELPVEDIQGAVAETRRSDTRILFRQGDKAERIHVVASGEVILTTSAFAGGEETVIDIIRAGTCFGEEAFLGHDHLLTATAQAGSRVLSIDPAILPRNDRSVLEHVYGRLSAMMTEVAALKSVAPAQRLARLLVSLADRSEGTASIPLPAKHKTMAAWVGVRPETFSSRLLPKLKSVGVSFEGNQIDIADIAALSSFAQTHSVMKGAR
jgi:CRP-like cAMP-binding protein